MPTLHHLDPARYDNEARRFADLGYQQCRAYGELIARRQGARCEHVAIESGGDCLGVALVRVRTAPVVGGGVAYVAGGPLTRPLSN